MVVCVSCPRDPLAGGRHEAEVADGRLGLLSTPHGVESQKYSMAQWGTFGR